ncbi:hypothetical protein MTP99_006554 [Tenebrio molitor]|nr:hypothetical protein MTP99_006554 [Tenebrio molitor]
MSIGCPTWRNVSEVVSHLRATCPPEYEVASVIGIKGREVVPCTWTVDYRLTASQENWSFNNFRREILLTNPENVTTTQLNVFLDGPFVTCQHVFRVACRDGPWCLLEGGLDHVMEGYAPELERVEGVEVMLVCSGVMERMRERDEGYASSSEEEEGEGQ